MRGARPCSAASPAATCGRGASRTAPRRHASSAIPISSAPTGRTAAATATRRRWPTRSRGAGARGGAGVIGGSPGGAPLLQVDSALIGELHARGFEIGLETNGTLLPPKGIDWICVSPKGGTPLAARAGHELKLVYPQPDAPPHAFAGLAFERFSLQPMDGPALAENTAKAVAYCVAHPQWRLSLQTHKVLGIR